MQKISKILFFFVSLGMRRWYSRALSKPISCGPPLVRWLSASSPQQVGSKTKTNAQKQLEMLNTQISALSHRRSSLLREVQMKKRAEQRHARTVKAMIRLASDPKALILERLRASNLRRVDSSHMQVKNRRTNKISLPPLSAHCMFLASPPVQQQGSGNMKPRMKNRKKKLSDFKRLPDDERRRFEETAHHNRQVVDQVGLLLATGSSKLSAEVDALIGTFLWTADR